MTAPAVPVEPGQRYGRLEVVDFPEREGRYIKVAVRCECGVEKKVYQNFLLDGRTRSCGCLSREKTAERSTTHGKSRSAVYAVWNAMVQRCTNPADAGYKNYGARGITVCRRWLSFENFLADMGEPASRGLSLERKNNDKGYSKSNCVWATRERQARNKANTVWLEFRGRRRSLPDIAEMTGVPYGRLYQRLFTYKWPLERAVKL